MRTENRQGIRGEGRQQFTMIGERAATGPLPAATPADARSANAMAAVGSGSAQPTIATPSRAKSRSRWMRAARPQPAIPILTTDVFIVPASDSPPDASDFSQTR